MMVKYNLIEQGYIPLDKSWTIRMVGLDLFNGYDDSIKYLEQHYEELSDDLRALHSAFIQWKSGKPIDVGESATLYRFLKFASWKFNLNKKFIKRGSLKKRLISDNPQIINYSLNELLKLDDGTSQWASASVLFGNREKIKNPPFKLKLTFEAVNHWEQKRKNEKCWEPRYDETILVQAKTYLDILNRRKPSFVAQQPEDYCFACAFGFIDCEDGKNRWPSLRGHESDRVIEMKKALESYETGKIIDSKDHRIIQAIAMLQKVNSKPIKIKHPSVTNKSWPQFWKFLSDSPKLKFNP